MGVLSSKYPNVQAVEDALNKALESVNQTDFNAFKSNVYTKSDTEAYTTEEKNKLSGISEGANKTVIDTTLSSISTNPVQNKVIKTSLDSKANSSDVYTKTESDSRFLNIDGTAKKAVADENGSNISETFSAVKNDIAVNRTTLGTQCKNLLKNNAVTKTVNGVTFTVNDDKSITVNGTATARIIFLVGTVYISQTGNYTYTGTPSGGASSTYSMNYRDRSSVYKTVETGSGITAQFEGGKTYEAVIDIRSGVTVSNLTFYPMIRYADITDDTYEPYKESVDERFIQNKSDIAVNKSTLGYQCKNLLKPISTITRAGITYTVNEDGSVTLTGKSTTGSTYNYFSIPITLKPGKYKVNGMPETSKTTTYRTDLRATESGGTTYGYGAKEFEVEFTEITTAYYMIRIDGTYKEELGGVTFYPMIRYADIIDDTYEPYQPSLQEQINALTARISALEGGV